METDPQRAERHAALRAAESRAEALFAAVEARGVIRPGARESEVNRAVYALARDEFGVDKHWHRRIVRAGRNTLCPYREKPPDLVIAADDIVFLDLGPVFEEWEADFGRTYVLGDDPHKHRLRDDVEACWRRAHAHFHAHEAITGAELYAFVCDLAAKSGWEYGQEHCGHLVGEFPHERMQGEELRNYIHPDNDVPMRARDTEGRPREWILEMHLVDRSNEVGAFVEKLLTVP
jgi:Xaa-Pro aminopeptidase